jgi:hypothetical protein
MDRMAQAGRNKISVISSIGTEPILRDANLTGLDRPLANSSIGTSTIEKEEPISEGATLIWAWPFSGKTFLAPGSAYPLPNHFVRILVFPDSKKDRLPETIVPGPLRELHLTNDRRFNPNATLHFGDG